MNVGRQLIGVLSGDLPDFRAHDRSPERPHMGSHLTRDVRTPRNVHGDLIRHLDEVPLFVIQSLAHTKACDEGRTSTAVTLYSGQLVAQSELSVVITFVPLTGWWKVV